MVIGALTGSSGGGGGVPFLGSGSAGTGILGGDGTDFGGRLGGILSGTLGGALSLDPSKVLGNLGKIPKLTLDGITDPIGAIGGIFGAFPSKPDTNDEEDICNQEGLLCSGTCPPYPKSIITTLEECRLVAEKLEKDFSTNVPDGDPKKFPNKCFYNTDDNIIYFSENKFSGDCSEKHVCICGTEVKLQCIEGAKCEGKCNNSTLLNSPLSKDLCENYAKNLEVVFKETPESELSSSPKGCYITINNGVEEFNWNNKGTGDCSIEKQCFYVLPDENGNMVNTNKVCNENFKPNLSRSSGVSLSGAQIKQGMSSSLSQTGAKMPTHLIIIIVLSSLLGLVILYVLYVKLIKKKPGRRLRRR